MKIVLLNMDMICGGLMSISFRITKEQKVYIILYFLIVFIVFLSFWKINSPALPLMKRVNQFLEKEIIPDKIIISHYGIHILNERVLLNKEKQLFDNNTLISILTTMNKLEHIPDGYRRECLTDNIVIDVYLHNEIYFSIYFSWDYVRKIMELEYSGYKGYQRRWFYAVPQEVVDSLYELVMNS